MAAWATPPRAAAAETVSDRLSSGWEGKLVGLAQKLVTTIETGGTPTQPSPAPPPDSSKQLEAALLEGSSMPPRRRPTTDADERGAPATELQLLQEDFDSLLLQRTRLRDRTLRKEGLPCGAVRHLRPLGGARARAVVAAVFLPPYRSFVGNGWARVVGPTSLGRSCESRRPLQSSVPLLES